MSKICFECGKTAEHEHHVIPECLGGTKTIPLCEECHSKVHGADLRLRELQKIGIKKALEKHRLGIKKWGGGGWNKTNPEIYAEVKTLRSKGVKLKEIAEKFTISIPTVYKILNDKINRTTTAK